MRLSYRAGSTNRNALGLKIHMNGPHSDFSARRVGLAVLLIAALASVFVVSGAPAQDVPPSVLRALQDRAGSGDVTGETAPKPVVQTFQPVVPGATSAPPSQLESLYSQRAGRPLSQFGYDFIGVPSAVSVVPTGEVKDSYVLGSGDELVIALRGQENSTYRQRVTSNGQVLLPKLPPINAAGRKFGDFRRDLEAQVAQAYLSTNVYVSLGELHQFTVLVTGEVRSPGARIVNALASPLDAILLSGGISKKGSLRNIRLVRDGLTTTIDLYSIIARGAGSLGLLRDGDRIYVPPLGPTVAIAGLVKNPGIYELRGTTNSIGANTLIQLAGGLEIAGGYNLSKAALSSSGATRLVPIPQGGAVSSGEILFVDATSNAGDDRVQLDGDVALSGTRPLSTARDTTELFHSLADLSPDAYGGFAVIVRRDPLTNSRILVPFSISASIAKAAHVAIQSYDRIYVFKQSDVRVLATLATKDYNTPYQADGGETKEPKPEAAPENLRNGTDTNLPNGVTPNTLGSPTNGRAIPNASLGTLTPELGALAQSYAIARQQGGTTDREPTIVGGETDEQVVARLALALGVPKEQLLRTASDNVVWVLDEVSAPGPYLAASGTTVDEIVRIAGGATQRADLSSVEVTSTALDQANGRSSTSRIAIPAQGTAMASVTLQPLDVIRLRSVYTDREQGTTTVAGEVRFPGIFDVVRDERLSSLLERAGGLTDVAYPYGAIFTRKSAALAERQGNLRAARELQSQLSLLSTSAKADENLSQPNLTVMASMIQQVRDAPALGRVMVTADPVVLAANPNLDLLLEPGDSLFIPKRPSSVTVSGEVLNPGSFQFRSGLGYGDYLRMAGGTTQSADSGNAFIVLPDGSAVPTSESWLTFSSGGHIPPGSTIIVPRDLRPFDWGVFLKDATQIFSQLAVTAASISVLRSN